ncbi:hypothetical protein FHU41_001759 [Psychromicrobium silvestre]|uniref:Uncharacterized protein n=1 Tax=Psychromicrobium silvestre TaxID=1645614 RepID=A0A7Y9S6L2_9MICC|nr:hypothetical protein [Psychromicrobium silvestre]NYE95509.1 hypothetical protein [Psychromicrobium silvestre]
MLGGVAVGAAGALLSSSLLAPSASAAAPATTTNLDYLPAFANSVNIDLTQDTITALRNLKNQYPGTSGLPVRVAIDALIAAIAAASWAAFNISVTYPSALNIINNCPIISTGSEVIHGQLQYAVDLIKLRDTVAGANIIRTDNTGASFTANAAAGVGQGEVLASIPLKYQQVSVSLTSGTHTNYAITAQVDPEDAVTTNNTVGSNVGVTVTVISAIGDAVQVLKEVLHIENFYLMVPILSDTRI